MSNETYTESWLVGPKSTKFYTRTYLPPSQQTPIAAVVFVHGYAEHIGRYTHFHPVFAARRIAVFTYDQRGYGLTAQDTKGNKSKGSAYGKTSWKEQMEDVAWAIEHARETFKGVPLFLMGHSMVRLIMFSKLTGSLIYTSTPREEVKSLVSPAKDRKELMHQRSNPFLQSFQPVHLFNRPTLPTKL